MKNYRKVAAVGLLIILLILVTLISYTKRTPPPDPTVSAQTRAPIALTDAPPPSMTTAPPYDHETHKNGYCEGNCWEGICPYFTGYPEPPFTPDDAEMLAKTVWGEARGCSPEEQRLVVWTALQRIDAGGEFRNYNTIAEVITKPNWFVGYDESHPVNDDIYSLCLEELADWWHGAEPPTHELYAPTAPYYFFDGDGSHNWFREEWR